jgi:hypothetical protein
MTVNYALIMGAFYAKQVIIIILLQMPVKSKMKKIKYLVMIIIVMHAIQVKKEHAIIVKKASTL